MYISFQQDNEDEVRPKVHGEMSNINENTSQDTETHQRKIARYAGARLIMYVNIWQETSDGEISPMPITEEETNQEQPDDKTTMAPEMDQMVRGVTDDAVQRLKNDVAIQIKRRMDHIIG